MYPVTYEADYLKERNRWTTFFRLILAIPWLIVASIYQIASLVVVIIAWFVLVVIGRYPEGLYNFVGGILRFSMRVNGWMYLQTDEWPSFSISDDPAYPIRVNFAPPAARQSRLKVFFRGILVLPLLVVAHFVSYMLLMVACISWLTIVFRGYQPAAIHNALAYALSWTTRFSAYAALMRDEYPPVGDEIPVDVDPPADAPALQSDPPPAIDPAAGEQFDAPGTPPEQPPTPQ